MSTLLYIPFSDLRSAAEARLYNLNEVIETAAEPQDICIVQYDSLNLRLYQSQIFTTRGIVGNEFWEVLIGSLSQKMSFDCLNRSASPIHLSVLPNDLALQKVDSHLRSHGAAILLVLRSAKAQLIACNLRQDFPSMVNIPFTDQDELVIQQEISRRAKNRQNLEASS